MSGSPVLLKWCQNQLESTGIKVTDFDASWKDGLAFCVLLKKTFNPKKATYFTRKKQNDMFRLCYIILVQNPFHSSNPLPKKIQRKTSIYSWKQAKNSVFPE